MMAKKGQRTCVALGAGSQIGQPDVSRRSLQVSSREPIRLSVECREYLTQHICSSGMSLSVTGYGTMKLAQQGLSSVAWRPGGPAAASEGQLGGEDALDQRTHIALYCILTLYWHSCIVSSRDPWKHGRS